MGHSCPLCCCVQHLATMIALLVVFAVAQLGSSLVVPAPVFVQWRSQDELGGYHFGYYGGPTSRAEHKDHVGVVRGAYNSIDGLGTVSKTKYISDALGYRILAATNLPVAPVAVMPAVAVEKGPEPVGETPAVRAAREQFEKTYKSAVDAAAGAKVVS